MRKLVLVVTCMLLACGGTSMSNGDAAPPRPRAPDAGDAGDSGLVWGNADAGPGLPIPKGTLLGLTASGTGTRVVRVDLPSGNVTELYELTAPTGYRTVGLTKRPDGTLYVVEQEPQLARTHLVRVDEATGVTIDDRVIDGAGSPGDYAADGTMWLGTQTTISSQLSTLDASGAPVTALDMGYAFVDDVACIGPNVYVLSSTLAGGGEDPYVVISLLLYRNGLLSPVSALGPYAIAPLGSDLIFVVGGSQLVAFDPSTETSSAPIATPYMFVDITED